jgi:ubiquinone/menaquinone biosynthesis C-methylase UbiE
MKTMGKNDVCSVERAGALDWGIRKLLQNPQKILKPYIKKGMTVLDVGCGPGYFTIEMAKMLDGSGKVVAADLQDGMLEIVKNKVLNSSLQDSIELHKCQPDRIGLTKEFDFILVFYMLHEVPNQSMFLKELYSLLKPDGRILIVEPKFHVTKNDFSNSVMELRNYGFAIIEEPNVFFSRAVLVSRSK